MDTNRKQNQRPSRLSDIAALAGVSRITVSKALLGTGGANSRMSEATRKKILKIAATVNYRPNMAARMLTGRRSGVIGVLVDSQAPTVCFECLRHMEKAAAAKGYRLMIAQQHEDVDSIFEYAMDFSAYGAEGLISFAHGYPALKEQIAEFMRVMPNVVYIGKPDFKDAASVEVDTESGIRALMEHLIKNGRKRIGIFLANPENRTIKRRYDGYVSSLRAAGMEVDERLILIDEAFKHENAGNVRRIIDTLVANGKADAIVAQNDLFAALIIGALAKRGCLVPADLAVTGFDDSAFAEAFNPPLTTVRQPMERLANEAVNMLHEMITGNSPGSALSIKPELILRGSA